MTTQPDQAMIDSLRAALASHGSVAVEGRWHPLSGGRTNRLWQVTAPGGAPVVVKLYTGDPGNPLFPNDPQVERHVLRHLQGQGIAPRLLDFAETPLGPCLIYDHVAGTNWAGGAAIAARALHRVHTAAPPANLRRSPDGSAALADQTRSILRLCSSHAARAAAALEPSCPSVAPSGQAALLHGDPVPGNMVVSGNTACLIDWQCPSIGDPCEDLAVFLSPAMQLAYRGHPLKPVERAAFLASYAWPGMADRYRALAPWYHWRMLAYCLWRHEQGDTQARIAAQAEQQALATLMQG